MILSSTRVGIDVSKTWLDVYEATTGKSSRIANREPDIGALVGRLGPGALVVLEATAPYDAALRRALTGAGVKCIRLNPSRARDFARAAGFLAKTDRIDAQMLACFPEAIPVEAGDAWDDEREHLAALSRRRDQLVEARAMDRTRSADAHPAELDSLARHIAWLDAEILRVEAEIRALMTSPAFAEKSALLRSHKGVGAVCALTLLALMPELGSRSAKTIAALAGLAPINRDSGSWRGRRRIGGGRRRVRQALYMAAISAIRTVPRLKLFYDGVKQRSGHAKVAIIAVARKILVTLNAMVKNRQPFRA